MNEKKNAEDKRAREKQMKSLVTEPRHPCHLERQHAVIRCSLARGAFHMCGKTPSAVTLKGCENILSHARQPTMAHYMLDLKGETVTHIGSLGETARPWRDEFKGSARHAEGSTELMPQVK